MYGVRTRVSESRVTITMFTGHPGELTWGHNAIREITVNGRAEKLDTLKVRKITKISR